MLHTDPFSPLDNPAWWALTGEQQVFATGTANSKRYRSGILPFAAMAPGQPPSLTELDNWLQPNEVFYVIGELPPLPPGYTLLKELCCVQMLLQHPIELQQPAPAITHLTALHSTHMYNLINNVQPGYYERDTWLLGNYYGIWHNRQLVAITGERMRLDHLTEISAICTHPDYTGRQYAQHLIAYCCNNNLAQGKTPFLHVLQTNERAIRLYEYLGFIKRRNISFWQIQKQEL
jgi:GNAT superfamily N-acetyltransferase